MKKLNLFFVIALIAGLGFFTGCEEETAVGPTITFFGGEFIDEDATVEPGAALDFKVSLVKGDAGLDEFVVVSQNADVFGPMTGTDLDNADQDYTINLTAPLNEGDYEYLFKLTDKDGLTDTKSIIITVEGSVTASLETYSDITLDNFPNGPTTGGSHNLFVDLETGDTYTQDDLEGDASLEDKIDIYFFRHSVFKATYPDFTLRSASNTGLKDLYDTYQNYSPTYAPSSMNTTTLEVVSVSDWAGLDIETIGSTTTGISGDETVDLDAGDFVGFTTSDGNSGIIKIEAVNPATSYLESTMKISIKIVVQ